LGTPFVELHALQNSVQAALQHVESTQNPLVHWCLPVVSIASEAHPPPFAFFCVHSPGLPEQ